MYRNKAFAKFDKLTAMKKLRTQHVLKKVAGQRLVKKERRAAETPKPLRNARKVCYVGAIGESLPLKPKLHVEEMSGRWRSWASHLVVVRDLSLFHDDCEEDGVANQVLQIVGLGLPVITEASWTLAQGDPDLVPKESVVRHRPLAMEKKLAFRYDGRFEARFGNLLATFKKLATTPGSKWTVGRIEAAPAAVGAETVQLTGVDVVRRFLQTHRRIYNVTGSRAWTLTERLV